ncbi:hypothetical protein MnTg03_01097 [bacterium MnTg03]|nr:hypothetical protein MnTg03_01097 [bacterium MnTg03]
MGFYRFDGFFLRVHNYRLVVYAKHTVGEKRQSYHMIHVRVGEENMPYSGHLIQWQVTQSSTCIYQ